MYEETSTQCAVLLEAFRRSQRKRGLSPATWERYSVYLCQLAKWLGDRHPADVTAQELEGYFDWWYDQYELRYGKQPSKNTARNHHCAVKSFFSYLERLDHVASNPLRKLDPPKGERKANDYLSPEEDERMLCAPVTPRERIIIAWLRYTGMRADVEATKVKQGDVDLSATSEYPWGCIIVRNSKTPRGRRVIPIFPELRVEIDRWYEFLRKLGLRDPYLPVLVTGEVTRCTCGTDKPSKHARGCPRSTNGKNLSEVTPHSLRRTFGSSLRREGKSIDAISKALGHSDSRTTEQHYVDLEDATVAREILSTG